MPRVARRPRRTSTTVLWPEYLTDLILKPLIAALRVLPERGERHDDPNEEGDGFKEGPDHGNVRVIEAGCLKSVRLEYPIIAEHEPENHQEGLDVADHLAGRACVDHRPLSVELVHLFLDLQWRLINEDLLPIAEGDGLELLGLVRSPGHQAVHEVAGVDGVVGREGHHEPMVERTGALHEGILLLLQHHHHVVDELAVGGGCTHLQDLLVFLAHLQEGFLHFQLPSKLVVLDCYDAEEHENMVAAGEERQHAELRADRHSDGHCSRQLVVPPWRGSAAVLLNGRRAETLFVFLREGILTEPKSDPQLLPESDHLLDELFEVFVVVHSDRNVGLGRPELSLLCVPQWRQPLLGLAAKASASRILARLLIEGIVVVHSGNLRCGPKALAIVREVRLQVALLRLVALRVHGLPTMNGK